MAMWGAPKDQPDHAERAARAALAMLAAVPELNARWQAELGEPLDLGIGLNSGPAQVGNTGSRYKFKYGPLGNTVNLASRVQGLTKYVKCRLLVTAATRRGLAANFIAGR
jgi:class 3 adenylate cyclase